MDCDSPDFVPSVSPHCAPDPTPKVARYECMCEYAYEFVSYISQPDCIALESKYIKIF